MVHLRDRLFVFEIGSASDAADNVRGANPGTEFNGQAFITYYFYFIIASVNGTDHLFALFPANEAFFIAVKANTDIYFGEKGEGPGENRSEERRVGKEGVSKCRSGWSRYH